SRQAASKSTRLTKTAAKSNHSIPRVFPNSSSPSRERELTRTFSICSVCEETAPAYSWRTHDDGVLENWTPFRVRKSGGETAFDLYPHVQSGFLSSGNPWGSLAAIIVGCRAPGLRHGIDGWHARADGKAPERIPAAPFLFAGYAARGGRNDASAARAKLRRIRLVFRQRRCHEAWRRRNRSPAHSRIVREAGAGLCESRNRGRLRKTPDPFACGEAKGPGISRWAAVRGVARFAPRLHLVLHLSPRECQAGHRCQGICGLALARAFSEPKEPFAARPGYLHRPAACLGPAQPREHLRLRSGLLSRRERGFLGGTPARSGLVHDLPGDEQDCAHHLFAIQRRVALR